MKFSTVVILAAASVACGPSLSDLSSGTLAAQVAGTPLFLRIDPAGSGCPSAPSSTKASVDGAALHTDSLGGSGGGVIGGCNAIQFSGSVPASADASFQVTDGHSTWNMAVPGYFAARGLQVVSPGTVIHVGDTVTATAVPSTDTFDSSAGATAEFVSDDGNLKIVVKNGVVVNGATVQFVMQAYTPALRNGFQATDGTLTVTPGLSWAKVTACSGPAHCTAQLDSIYATRVTLAP